MTERDVPFLQGGNYTAAEVRRIVTALTGARDFVDLAPSTSPLVSAGGGHGVVGSADMTVTAGAGTTVNVAAGVALVRGTQQSDQGVYTTSNDAAKNLTISAADATNPRKDLIVTRVKDAEYGIAGDTGPLEVVTGTPTGGLTAGNVTGRPTPPENSLILAEVFIPAAAASSASYTITDLRTRAYALGGNVVCTLTTRPNPAYEGLVIFQTDTDEMYVYDGAAWQLKFKLGGWTSYTPTNSAITLGNGTNPAAYRMLDPKTCAFRWGLIWGSTTAYTGDVLIGLPFPAAARQVIPGWMFDLGTRNYLAAARILTAGDVLAEAIHTETTGNTASKTDADAPITWATGDHMTFTGIYEIQ